MTPGKELFLGFPGTGDPSKNRYSTTEGRFSLGPLLFQRIMVELGLSASATTVMFQLFRLALEGYSANENLSALIEEHCDLDRRRIVEALRELNPLLIGVSGPLVGCIELLLKRLCGAIGDWYLPLDGIATRRAALRAIRTARAVAGSKRRPPELVVLTGFLGSGKTTLLNAMLRHRKMQDAIVFINEAGATPVDQLNVRVSEGAEDPVMLAGGCLCCRLGESFVDDLKETIRKRDEGRIPWFDSILVETSGIADPSAIVRAIQEDIELRRMISYRGTITTVDLAASIGDLTEAPESTSQLAAADWVVLTKADLVDGDRIATARSEVEKIRPGVRIVIARSSADAASNVVEAISCGSPLAEFAGSFELAPMQGHTDRLSVVNLRVDTLSATVLRIFCDVLAASKGEEFFRMKGVVGILGRRSPLFLQSVRGGAHSLEWLPEYRGTRGIVIIARRLDSACVNRVLASITAAFGN